MLTVSKWCRTPTITTTINFGGCQHLTSNHRIFRSDSLIFLKSIIVSRSILRMRLRYFIACWNSGHCWSWLVLLVCWLFRVRLDGGLFRWLAFSLFQISFGAFNIALSGLLIYDNTFHQILHTPIKVTLQQFVALFLGNSQLVPIQIIFNVLNINDEEPTIRSVLLGSDNYFHIVVLSTDLLALVKEHFRIWLRIIGNRLGLLLALH